MQHSAFLYSRPRSCCVWLVDKGGFAVSYLGHPTQGIQTRMRCDRFGAAVYDMCLRWLTPCGLFARLRLRAMMLLR